MTNTNMTRRSWLRNGALLTGGLALIPGLTPVLAAENHLQHNVFQPFISDNDIARETTPPEIKARLSANENPFGPSEKAKKAIIASVDGSYRYAFFEGRKMIEMITEYEGLEASQVLTSAGSGPLLLAGAILYKHGTIISSQPTYEDLLSKAETMGGKVIRLPLTPSFTYDLNAIERAVDSSTSLVYICNPNNPTATTLDPEKLKSFCERVSKKVPVFVDEAYIDLVEKPEEATLIPLVKKGHNIIVARTFSKLYGMAGMRFGYMVAQPDIIKKFNEISPGANSISATTWAAAIASYQDKAFMKESYDNILASKKYLYGVLKEEGYEYIPSSTNFVIFPVKEDSKDFANKMMNNGVSVRSWEFNQKQWCRVSIGTMDEMKSFALSLAKLS